MSGWGRTSASIARVVRPHTAAEAAELLGEAHDPALGLLARGAGRSYGDAAQLGGGEVIDMRALDRILDVDPAGLTVRAQAGATIAALMRRLAEDSLTLPVVPGTRYVTLGGAIASDIHGKNHHCDGAFARHVQALTLWTPSGGVAEVTPESDAALFYATLGGMGLTGVVLEAQLRVERLASPWVAQDTDRTDGLEQTLALLSADEGHRYSVAWLDMLAPGARMGRAVITQADPLQPGSVPSGRRVRAAGAPKLLGRGPAFELPSRTPGNALQPQAVRLFNDLRWRSHPRRESARPVALAPYFFPLDALGDWNRLYGPSGLIQYQLATPAGEEKALLRCFEVIRARRVPVYLAVFKRFGDAFGGPLSFPLAGWTLAIDIPARASGLEQALRELDELVAGCGGRVYLTKDARLPRATVAAMYPRLAEFNALCSRADPDGLLRSDLSLRTGIGGASA